MKDKVYKFLKTYGLLLICTLLLGYGIKKSYSNYLVSLDKKRVSEMYNPGLTFQLLENGIEKDVFELVPGDNVIDIEIKNNNPINVKYKLVYKNLDNVDVTYTQYYVEPYGNLNINGSKKIRLVIVNNSNNTLTIELNAFGGYKNNDLNDIIIKDGYTAITILNPNWDYNCTSDSSDLRCKMITAETVSDDSSINFAKVSSNTNGKALYYTSKKTVTEGGKRVYYYRGNIGNNYVSFAGFCWKIIRTNESGGIRLRYNGTMTSGSCKQTGSSTGIETISFNSLTDSNAGLGYMYGSKSSSYEEEHKNTNDSLAKQSVDKWYASNISGKYDNYIENAIYCNDRKISQRDTIGGQTNSKLGYGSNITFYGFADRLIDSSTWNPKSNAQPTYVCERKDDQFTLSVDAGGTDGYGNNKLTYPVGLTSGDEAAFAGAVRYNKNDSSTNNSSFFMYTGEWNWTMTPGYYSYKKVLFYVAEYADVVQIRDNGSLDFDQTYGKTGAIIPVISLKGEVQVSGGTGLYNDPYIVLVVQ